MTRQRLLGIVFCLIAMIWTGRVPVNAEPLRQEEEPAAETEEAPAVAPDVPVQVYPAGSLVSRELGFYWEPAENAESYQVNWENDRGGKGELDRENSDWTCRSGRCTVFAEMPSDGNYTWTVTAVNGEETAASEEMSFSIASGIAAPVPYRPNTALSNQKPLTIEWEDAGFALYRVQLAERDNNRLILDQQYETSAMYVGNGVCSRTTEIYLPSGYYKWRIMGENGSGSSAWSGWQEFEITCAECNLGTYQSTSTVVITPSGVTAVSSPSFEWMALTGTNSYQLTVRDAGGNELLNESIQPDVCTLESCMYTPELNLTAGADYSWTVASYGWNNSFWGSSDGSFKLVQAEAFDPELSFVGMDENVSLDPENQQIIWTDPGSETVTFRVGIFDAEESLLFLGDLTREAAWCDGLTCSIQFRTIPTGADYQLILIPYDEYNNPGTPAVLNFSNEPEE